LVVNNVEKAQDSYKSRMARKWGIPVVSIEFVSRCLEEGKLLEADSFIVVGKTAAQEFSSGKIIGMCLCSNWAIWQKVLACKFHSVL
jgi:poly [ADP-ribose] polymerase